MIIYKKFLVPLILLVITSVAVFLIYSPKKSITDINADNYINLKENKSLSLTNICNELANYFTYPAIFSDAKNMSPNTEYSVDKNFINGYYFVEISEKSSGNTYSFRYADEKSKILQVLTISHLFSGKGLEKGEEFIQELLNNNEFVLKKSLLKKHDDIIIKEIGSCFLIGRISRLDNGEIYSMSFHIYDR